MSRYRYRFTLATASGEVRYDRTFNSLPPAREELQGHIKALKEQYGAVFIREGQDLATYRLNGIGYMLRIQEVL